LSGSQSTFHISNFYQMGPRRAVVVACVSLALGASPIRRAWINADGTAHNDAVDAADVPSTRKHGLELVEISSDGVASEADVGIGSSDDAKKTGASSQEDADATGRAAQDIKTADRMIKAMDADMDGRLSQEEIVGKQAVRKCAQPSECPASMPHRYPGNNRCFEKIWGGSVCNVDPKNDPHAHQRGDTQCDCEPADNPYFVAAEGKTCASSGADDLTASTCRSACKGINFKGSYHDASWSHIGPKCFATAS
jgi:hypothetical protein